MQGLGTLDLSREDSVRAGALRIAGPWVRPLERNCIIVSNVDQLYI
jgi:hypothetical protein